MQRIGVFMMVILLFVSSCAPGSTLSAEKKPKANAQLEIATFAGGCFWCMEHAFEQVEGVISVLSGFSGGEEKDPSYKAVSSGQTGHVETIRVTYDAKQVSYKHLLDVFWRNINPTDAGGQFVDRGKQYLSAIFYHSAKQKQLAEASKTALEKSGKYDKPIVTEIKKFVNFYPAEEYHQDYYKKSPIRYKSYRYFSGRDQYIEKVWGKDGKESSAKGFQKPSDAELKKRLTPLQYKVTQLDGTERAFANEYNDNKAEGIYVDVVSGEPLFSSLDKYDSKTGWPSFTKPLVEENIVTKKDFKLVFPRTEARSKGADSHLGHLFKDGPKPTGLRYCINSAALRFIPKKDLEKEGYGEYKELFK